MHIFWLIVLYIMFFTQGAVVSIVGPMWPWYVEELGLESSQLGMLTAVMFTFAIITELGSFNIRKILGNTYSLLLGFVATIIFLVLLYKAESLLMLYVAVAFLGLGIGIVDATINAFAALYYDAKYVSWIHAIYGIGGVISSLIISSNISHGKGFIMCIYYFIAFVVVSIILLIVTKVILKLNLLDTGSVGVRVREEKADVTVNMISVLKNKNIIILLFIFFLVDGIKWVINAWLPTYLVDVGTSTYEYAARSLSFFLASYMLSRIVFGALSNFLSDKKILNISCIISLIGSALLIMPITNNNLILTFVIISGLGSGAFYPFFSHFTNEVCDPKEVGAVVAYSGTVAVLGDIFQGLFMGIFVEKVGLKYMFIYYIILMALIYVCFLFLSAQKNVKAKN